MKSNKISPKFLELYNKLDDFMRDKLKADAYVDHATLLRTMADNDRIFAEYYKDLKVFSRLRNLLVHNSFGKDAEPLFIPHEYLLKRYRSIVDKILNPQKAFSICVRREFIYTASLSDSALEVMNVMNDKTYTHIPIIENGIMIGVFSENTLLSYIAHHEESILLKDVKIGEFKKFIPLKAHPSEYFEFVNRDALVIDVEELFRKGFKSGKRVSVVFITQNGKHDEKILGMLTAWDVLGSKSYKN